MSKRILAIYPHPDHDALSAATIVAVTKLLKDERPEIRCAAMTRNRYEKLGKPQLEKDVTKFLDEKMEAIRAHKSQTEALFQRLDELILENPDKKADILSPYAIEQYWIYHLNSNDTSTIKEVV